MGFDNFFGFFSSDADPFRKEENDPDKDGSEKDEEDSKGDNDFHKRQTSIIE